MPPEYTNDWFSQHIPTWEKHLSHLPGTPCQLLEVGSYEGRSAIWMAGHLMTHPDSFLTCLDAGCGVGNARSLERLRLNIRTLPNKLQVHLRVKSSLVALPDLGGDGAWVYDLIYIDGSHVGGDAIRDLCNAWPLLREGGIMIVDDYRFQEPGVPPHAWAGPAIDYFLSLYQDQLTVLHQEYQVIVRKLD